MASKIHRRSGKAVVEYCNLIEFTPELVCLVGVGIHHAEVDCMIEAWEDIELYGFEPHPDTFKTVNETFPGMLYPYAVSDKKGKQTLYSKPKHKDGASLFPKIIEEDRILCKEFEVQTMTLDGVLHTFRKDEKECFKNRKGLLWLDCEGNEKSALIGGKYFINRSISVINVEMTGKPRSKGWSKPVDVHKKLTEYGFLQAWIHTNRSGSGQHDAIYLRRELFRPEYCSVPSSILMYGN